MITTSCSLKNLTLQHNHKSKRIFENKFRIGTILLLEYEDINPTESFQ